jgi:stearoyl-CoA desaturase (delta-9 desaturase)
MSRNNWLVGLLAFGEGWHNNHHAFPRSALHRLRWWEVDLSDYIIWGMERLGLAQQVWRISAERLLSRSRIIGPSSTYGHEASMAREGKRNASYRQHPDRRL